MSTWAIRAVAALRKLFQASRSDSGRASQTLLAERCVVTVPSIADARDSLYVAYATVREVSGYDGAALDSSLNPQGTVR